jgi:glycosyltransferase involved in cell wall biosynthesis
MLAVMTQFKFLLHNKLLTERGESTNALANVTLLKNFFNTDSILSAPESQLNNSIRIQELRKKGLKVFLHRSLEELQRFCLAEEVTHVLWQNDGKYCNLWVPSAKNLVHAVFNNFEPYGDKYAYVSRWLYKTAVRDKNGRNPFEIETERQNSRSPYSINTAIRPEWVPHAVIVQVGDGDHFRKKHGIPKEAVVVGRIGALTEFNDQDAKLAVKRVLDSTDFFFVFVNTFPFISHKRVRFTGYVNDSEKWDFYAACNVFLNARLMGESFGFTIAEPLMLGKPVIGPHQSRNKLMDKHHIEILKSENLLYRNARHLELLIKEQALFPINPQKAQSLVSDFSIENVARVFHNVFIRS